MPLEPGAKLGPYEVVTRLGAGGMGEVYRARDSRLGREVAVKVLPTATSADPERLRRFEQEARSTGALSHPNVLAVFDVGVENGLAYVVSELLEGETLHERMERAPLAIPKALGFAVQIAHGLAAAHEKGIVHRDLKPENLFVTKDGRLKILDFGLAKLDPAVPMDARHTSPLFGSGGHAPVTTEGTILGTVGYISPEQVRGDAADARSDLFSFGVILYQMLAGKAPFQRDTAVEGLHAILKDEPPPLAGVRPEVPPALDRVVERCLEKDPDHRFQTARDLAFHLDAISAPGVTLSHPSMILTRRRRAILPRRALPLVIAAAGVVALAAAFLAGRRTAQPVQATYQQLTFRRGIVHAARFAPDGQTLVYSSSWEGNPPQLFQSRPESPEFRALEPRSANVLAISPKGEMALMLLQGRAFARGTLARAPLGGGAPRMVADEAEWADWGPDGDRLALVRSTVVGKQLEYPIGTVLYETTGWISHARVSPQGDAVAFIDHPVAGDNRGSVEIVDTSKRKRTLSEGWKSIWGLAWPPHGREVWFTASDAPAARAMYGVDLSGRRRLIARLPLRMTLQDISRDGRRVLVTHDMLRRSTFGQPPGETQERDLSWFDYTNAKDLSPDGRTLLFSEDGEGGGAAYATYIRRLDGSPAVRLGDGKATALSPEGAWALSIRLDGMPQRLLALPTGVGEPRELPRGPIDRYEWASWMPDGRVLASASVPGGRTRLWVQDFPSGTPRAISSEGIRANFGNLAVAPDGRAVAALDADQRIRLYALEGDGKGQPLAASHPGEAPFQWSEDGRLLYVFDAVNVPAQVWRIDVTTGERQPWKALFPADPAGVLGVTRVRATPDAAAYVYTFSRILSDLYLVEGLE